MRDVLQSILALGEALAGQVSAMNEPTPPTKPMPGQLVISRRLEADCVVLLLYGELDIATSDSLERELRDAESVAPGRLVIDLSGLGFMDSTGLRTLLLARERVSSNGRQLLLRRGPQAVQRLFELTRTLERFSFVD